jgi:pyruvate kinase
MKQLLEAGMDVARLNFSHGTHEAHQQVYDDLRAAEAQTGKNLGIMLDLQGPKIRTGKLADGEPIFLSPGDPICITTRDILGDQTTISTSYKELAEDVNAGDTIFLADGILQFAVDSVDGDDVQCTVVQGGHLGEHKGINLPGVRVSAPSLTQKDRNDLQFGLTQLDIDFVALSFVRTAQDIVEIKKIIDESGKHIAVIAKIERPEGVENFDEILTVTDGVMLARGDLGVEVPLHEVPQIQKRLINKCNDAGVPVITATQMFESMITNVRPTRAEVSDVSNAIYDGTDAVMLSGETASGMFPVEAVQIMSDVAAKTDAALMESPPRDIILRMREAGIRKGRGSYGDAIAQAACRTAHAIRAKRIVCFTKMGYTAALIARYRPTVPITAVTMEESIRHRCAVIWGVDTIHSVEPCDTDNLDEVVDQLLLENDLAKEGDTVIIAGGFPLVIPTRTNMLKLHTVGVSLPDKR